MYVQSDTLVLFDVFNNSQSTCLETYRHPLRFLSATGLAWKAALKSTKVKSDLLSDIIMLLMVENVKGGICYANYLYMKLNKKYMNDYNENKESSYFTCWDINNLYG